MVQSAQRLREIEQRANARGDKNLAAEARAQAVREGFDLDETREDLETSQDQTPVELDVPPRPKRGRPKKADS